MFSVQRRRLVCRGLVLLQSALFPGLAAAQSLGDDIGQSVFLLIAFAFGGLTVFMYFHVIRAERGMEPDAERRRTALILSSGERFFYYHNLATNQQWFSHKLRELLGIQKNRANFESFAEVLPETDFERLQQAVVDLKAGEEKFEIQLQTRDGLPLECFGTLRSDMGQQHLVLWWRDYSQGHEKLRRQKEEHERYKRELQMMNNALNALPFPLWIRDQELAMRFCNLAFMEALEERSDSASADQMEIYTYGRKLALAAQETGKARTERRHIILEGERKLFDISEIPWGKERFLTGTAMDISELEAVSQELEHTRSMQGDLLESITSAIAIYGPDQRLQYYNQAYIRLWKLQEAVSWLNSHPRYSEILELLRENRILPEQANFPAFKTQHLKLFTDLIEPHEEFFYLPDNRTIRVLAIPHSRGGLLFAYEDVTDRLALERSYNTLIAVQKQTLDNLQEGVAVFGEDGRLRLSNPVHCEMWGISREMAESNPHINDLLERNQRLYYYEDWEEFKQNFVSDMVTNQVVQKRMERTDGKVLDMISVPLPNGQTLLNYVDITDSTLAERFLHEKNEALIEADRVKTEFLTNISYELRSPLTSISGFSEMLRQGYFGGLNEQQSEYVQNIHDATQHLMALIDDIIDIASIEAGYMQLEIATVNVPRLLEDAATLVNDRARGAGIKLETHCAKDAKTLPADENRLRQVLYNLLSNAVKYTERGGRIFLSATILPASEVAEPKVESAHWLAISVKDNGAGIPEAEQEAVFGKFYRAANSVRIRSGTGLGLSVVKSLIELHGGAVKLESTIGQGTEVICYLPLEPQISAA
jgi:signal transduction histidine kinase